MGGDPQGAKGTTTAGSTTAPKKSSLGSPSGATSPASGSSPRPYPHPLERPMFTPKGVLRLDVTTDNPAVQVYTGYWLDTPRKVVHGGPDVNYTKWSAVAIEQEGYIDAINTPEWGVDQICECTFGFSFGVGVEMYDGGGGRVCAHLGAIFSDSRFVIRRLSGEGLRVGVGVQVLHRPVRRGLLGCGVYDNVNGEL